MNLLFPELYSLSETCFTDHFQAWFIVSETANYSREPTYKNHKYDLHVMGDFGQAIQTLWTFMFEATNASCPTIVKTGCSSENNA